MGYNANFNNISAISLWSVLLVEYPEKAIDLPQVTDKHSFEKEITLIVLYKVKDSDNKSGSIFQVHLVHTF
jgi:hypothetical protein